jgi:hypothetical protein
VNRDDAEARAQDAARGRDAELRASEPERKRARGIVHTPREIAAFMAERAWQAALRACPRRELVVVDPACGTGVFGAAWLAAAASDVDRASRTRALVGLDLDAAAITAARGVLTEAAERAGVALDLRVADTLTSLAPLGEALVAGAALVVLGNPPWAGRSASRGSALSESMLDDFRADVRGERKLGVLSDDYVRFFRWGAELVRRSEGGGVLALVTNASFLDGPVHRGMRAALLRWLDSIDVVDLGGSALVAHGRGADENVFGVRPSVAITIGARGPGRAEPRSAVVTYARVHGSAAGKREQLSRGDVGGAAFVPTAPAHRLSLTVGARASTDYAAWPSIDTLFHFHREGVQTNRDSVLVDTDRARLIARLERFAAGADDADLAPVLRASAHFQPARARAVLREALARGEDVIAPLAYRPLDTRWHCFLTPLCHRPRPELARAMAHSRLALVTARKDRGTLPFAHAGVVDVTLDNCWFSVRSSCRARAFPTRSPEGEPNVDVRAWEDRLGVEISPATVVHYALAVLSAPAFRERFDGLLREDYPRLPPPPDALSLWALASAGERLAQHFLAPVEPRDATLRIGHHEVSVPRAMERATTALDALVVPLLGVAR